MSITEIKTVIAQLPEPDLAELAQWIEEFQADAWDRQIERDVKAGRFEAIFKQIDKQAKAGQSKRARQAAPLQGEALHDISETNKKCISH